MYDFSINFSVLKSEDLFMKNCQIFSMDLKKIFTYTYIDQITTEIRS